MKSKRITANIPEYIKKVVEQEELQRYRIYTYPELKNREQKKVKWNLPAIVALGRQTLKDLEGILP